MNERQFQAWLVERAPVTVPVSLRERVGAIPTDASTGRPRQVGVGSVRSLARTRVRRRTVAFGLLAAALTGSIVAAGVMLIQRHDQLPGNGLIVVATGEAPEAVDPTTGEPVVIRDLAQNGRTIDPSLLTGAAHLAWSPDGRQVAFVGRRSDLRVLDLDSGAIRTVAEEASACVDSIPCGATWSPDGRALAYTSAATLRRVDAATGNVTTLAMTGGLAISSPSWSPDGRTIAFASDDGLFVVGSHGGEPTRLFSDLGDRAGPLDVHWSPDGRWIGFLTSDEFDTTAVGWNLRIEVIAPDGSDRHVIADTGVCFCMNISPGGFTWSPDGTQIAFVTPGFRLGGRVHDPTTPLDGGLYVAKVDGSGRRLLIPDISGSPAWQPVP